jgi:phosphatidate cytidylyltransferase
VDANLRTRILTALGLGSLFVGAVVFSEYSSVLIFLIISLLGSLEFFSLISKNTEVKPQSISGSILGITLFMIGIALTVLANSAGISLMEWEKIGAIFIVLFLGIAAVEIFRKSTQALQNVSTTLFGALYTCIPFALLINAGVDAQGNYAPWTIMGFFFIIWASDTGAYFVGRSFGKHKLAERLSPKKTVEGFIGGIISSAMVAYLISLYNSTLHVTTWIVCGTVLAVAGTAGDLFESMLKRQLGVKDSGNILPGHGGILDRFDSTYFAAPVYWMFIKLLS